ncbi:MAG: putative metal-binding motif-containing protein, partial [Deltaproteobacteria bacterium]|nr:putative metal-binding motif-containing protein [Deltaproteobacteria bacterium]
MKGMVSWMPVVLVCVACGGGLEGEGEEVLFGVGAEDGGPAPRGAGPGSAPGDTAWGDGFEEAAPDASPGAFGWPCGEPGDCTSGFCVPAASGDGGFCTVPCIEDCPPGTSCRLAPQTLPDPIYICLPAYPAPWCRPCREASDCEDPWADEALECHEVSPWEGSFCTRGCLEDIDCSQGFSCMDGRCLPPGGCSCLEGPDATGWSTDCEATGRVGVCPGTRTCGEAGMSPCSAFIPQEEVCNGVDDDCDGLVDPPGVPGCSTFWRDGDGDGRGAGDPACLCGAQAGWVQQAGDCDDADPTVSPAAMEHCDLEDDDCDGVVDEAPAVGCLPCWLDADGDGWGGTEPACFCVPAAPWVLVDGDCDDQRPEVHPSAMELCDGADQDCDGVEDAVCDGDGDGWCAGPVPPSGCAPEAINYGVCQALHLAKLLLYCPAGYGDCQDGDGSVHPGAPELCDGKDQDCDAVVDEGMDLDGDGWCGGSGGACCPLGGGDCEDLDPAVHPGAGDLPDSLLMDTNCDGLDGDLSDAVMVHGVLGQDFFPGTPELPKRTLTAAVQEAVVQGVSQVLVG